MTIQDFEDSVMTVADFAEELDTIKNSPLPAEVKIDELGNTMPAMEYRRMNAWLLKERILRIAWQEGVMPQVRAIANDAQRFTLQG